MTPPVHRQGDAGEGHRPLPSRVETLSDEMLRDADVVITVCGHADEHCPALPPHIRKIHWPIDDPAVLSGRAPEEVLAAFRLAHDEIESWVREFLSTLERQ